MTTTYTMELSGQAIEVIESAGDGPAIFAFHGNSSAANCFLPLIDGEFGNKCKVIAVSFPGHGLSSPAANPDEMYSIPALGDFAARVVHEFGYERYLLVGHSLGGHALLEGIARFGNALGLFLISSPPLSIETLHKAFKPDPSNGLLFQGNLSEQEIELLASCFSERLNEHDLKVLRNNIRITDEAFRPALGKSIAQGRMLDEIRGFNELQIPVALIGGSNDRFLYTDYFLGFSPKKLWRGRAQIVEGHSHTVHMESTGLFTRLLGEFLDFAMLSDRVSIY